MGFYVKLFAFSKVLGSECHILTFTRAGWYSRGAACLVVKRKRGDTKGLVIVISKARAKRLINVRSGIKIQFFWAREVTGRGGAKLVYVCVCQKS